MTKKYLVFAAALSASFINSCAPRDSQLSPQGKGVLSELGCDDAETRLFDRLIEGTLATDQEAQTLRYDLMDELRRSLGSSPNLDALDRLLTFLLEEAPRRAQVGDADSLRDFYTGLELGLHSDPAKKQLALEYQSLKAGVFEGVRAAGVECSAPLREKAAVSTPSALATAAVAQVFGMHWAFATAYQSCEALTQRALVRADPNVKGIVANGMHPDGIGRRRFIDDLAAVQRTHPYLKAPPSSGACVDVRNNPLIYDYGGKPYTTGATIDFHKNAGDGTSVLGIDCSGFVASAHATAGLKFKSSVPLRPSQGAIFSSSDFADLEDSGLDCMARIPVGPGGSLKNGDVVAVHGHVFMIDHVGSDPFGVLRASKVQDCDGLTTAGFDFEIFQSSPSKDGVGLNHFVARDYLPESDKMSTGLRKYAVQTCKNRFAGTTTVPRYSDLTVSRHKGTEACKAARVPVAHESCVQGCFVE